MDLILFSASMLTAVVTTTGGYFLIQYIWPYRNKQLAINKAFKKKDYDAVILLTEGCELKYQNSLNIHLYAAESRINRKMYVEALMWLETALIKIALKDSDSIFIEIKIGDVYMFLKQYNKAEMHYRIAVSINPKHELANHKLSEVLFFTKKYESCRKSLRFLLKKNPSLIDSRKLYADCLSVLGKHSKAIRHYGILIRSGQDVMSYYYAHTLFQLKIYDKAYNAFNILLGDKNSEFYEHIICNLIKSSVSMQKYHEAIGTIEKFMLTLKNPDIIFELKYIKASILYLRGDQILALNEYKNLYLEKPTYQDLSSIIQKESKLLDHAYLCCYFTSQESLFELLIAKMLQPGFSILRRSSEYYLCLVNNHAYVFYRHIKIMPLKIVKNIDILLINLGISIDILEIWTLNGLSNRYNLSGINYQFSLQSNDHFLSGVEKASIGIDYSLDYEPTTFISGFKDLRQIIPLADPLVQKVLDEAPIHDLVSDEQLNKAFEK